MPAQQFTAALLNAAGEVVEPFPVAAAAPQVFLEGLPGRVASHDVVGDGVQRLCQVNRRRQRGRVRPRTGRTGTGGERSWALLSFALELPGRGPAYP